MKNSAKVFTKKATTLLLTFLMIFSLLSSIATTGAFAEEVSAEVQAVIDLVDKLPADPEMTTAEDKDNIVAAKLAYEALTNDQKQEIPPAKLTLISANVSAVMPLILAEVVSDIKKLPETDKLTSSDKDKILDIYKNFSVLDGDAKAACSKEYKTTLLLAVDKLSPDTITEDEKAVIDEYKKELAEQEAKKVAAQKEKTAKIYKTWQYILMALALLLLLFSIVIIVILIVKIVKA